MCSRLHGTRRLGQGFGGPWLLAVGVALSTNVWAVPQSQWPADPRRNLSLAIGKGGQTLGEMVDDNQGGALVVYTRGNYTYGATVMAQHVRADGQLLWRQAGNRFCMPAHLGADLQAVPDGEGGLIAAWLDDRDPSNYAVYAQRLDRNGVPQWDSAGVFVAAAYWYHALRLVSDDAGGAIVVYAVERVFGAFDLYAQRIDPSGQPLWGVDGVPVCTADGQQILSAADADGRGGVVVCWRDPRDDDGWQDHYVQRISAGGQPQWGVDGLRLTNGRTYGWDADLLGDGNGGAFVVWPDTVSIVAQHLGAVGEPLWGSQGINLTLGSWGFYPDLVSDNAGGVIVSWADDRAPGYGYSPYVQRIAADGRALWQAGGIPVSSLGLGSEFQHVVSDGRGGAIIAWEDYRDARGSDIYAQRITADGAIPDGWPAEGAPVSTADRSQAQPILLSVFGGAIVVWNDYRTSDMPDLYMQRIRLDGRLGPLPERVVNNDLGVDDADPGLRFQQVTSGSASLRFFLKQAERVQIKCYEATGRKVADILDDVLDAGDHTITWSLRDADDRPIAAGLYTFVLTAGDQRTSLRSLVLNR